MRADELSGIGLFERCSAGDLEHLAGKFKRESHPRGSVLVEEGDLPTKFYVLLSGHVTVHKEGGHLADLGPGDFFGELGVLSMEGRNASVITTTPCEVAVAMGWDLRQLLDDMPPLRSTLVATAAARG